VKHPAEVHGFCVETDDGLLWESGVGSLALFYAVLHASQSAFDLVTVVGCVLGVCWVCAGCVVGVCCLRMIERGCCAR